MARIDGTSGSDDLTGRATAGDDQIYGYAGDDIFAGFAGNDVFYGGDGYDLLSYVEESSQGGSGGATINLAAGIATDTFGDTDSVTDIDDVRGSMSADTVTGNDNDNLFLMLAGDDIIDGAGRFDRVSYWEDYLFGGTSGINANFETGQIVDGFGDTDTVSIIEFVRGTQYDDTMLGSSARDERFAGFHGDDVIDGGAGGYDTVRYDWNDKPGSYEGFEASTTGVVVDLGAGTANDGFGTTDTLININRVYGSRLGDSITGGGDDTWESFVGMAGDDTFDGAGSFDRVNYSQEYWRGGTAAVTVDLETGTATDAFGDTDTLIDIQSVRGTAQADTLRGAETASPQSYDYHDGLERFHGLAGADLINGRGGDRDQADYRWDAANGGAAAVTVDLAANTATDGFGDTDTLYNIEEVRGTAGDDTLRGDDRDNRFEGLAGNDLIDGRGGRDLVDYGQEYADGGTAAVTVDLAANTATDGFGNTDTLYNIEDIRGTDGADTLRGDEGDNRFEGRGGDDTLAGRGGNDSFVISDDTNTVDGGAGYDTARFNDTLANFGGISRSGGDIIVGDENTFTDVEVFRFTDREITASDLAAASTIRADGSGDFNGDGTDDILWQNASTGGVGQFQMNQGTPSWAFVGNTGNGYEFAGTGDFNGDGTDDVLWTNPGNNRVGQYEMSGGNASWQPIARSGGNFEAAGTGDFDGDGTDDILWINTVTGGVGQHQMANGRASWDFITSSSGNFVFSGTGDFDGDGTDDLFWHNTSTGQFGQHQMTNGNASWASLGTAGGNFQFAGTGDFDGDGSDDLLWFNPTSGQVGFHEVSGSGVSWNAVGTAGGSFTVAGTGDYNGDGTDDVLWYNSATGSTGQYVMNNGQATWQPIGQSGGNFSPLANWIDDGAFG